MHLSSSFDISFDGRNGFGRRACCRTWPAVACHVVLRCRRGHGHVGGHGPKVEAIRDGGHELHGVLWGGSSLHLVSGPGPGVHLLLLGVDLLQHQLGYFLQDLE